MASAGMTRVLDLWEHDENFRARLRSDPEGAVRDAGITITPEEMNGMRDKLARTDWNRDADTILHAGHEAYR